MGADGRQHVEGSTYRSPELRLTVTAGLAILLGGWLALAALDRHTDFLLVDFREWRLTASPDTAPDRSGRPQLDPFLRGVQPDEPARRPFRLTLELPGVPHPGRWVAAERLFRVDPLETYCFEVWTWNPDPGGDRATAADGFRIIASIDGEPVAVVPIGETGQGRRIAVDGITVPGGRVLVRLEVRSVGEEPQELRRAASRTHFDFASFRECPGGG